MTPFGEAQDGDAGLRPAGILDFDTTAWHSQASWVEVGADHRSAQDLSRRYGLPGWFALTLVRRLGAPLADRHRSMGLLSFAQDGLRPVASVADDD